MNGNGHSGPPRRTNRSQPTETGSVPVPPAFQGTPHQQGQFAQPPQPPSPEALHAEFEQLLAMNQAKFAQLAEQGISPDPFYLVHARINHLIDQIAAATGPNGPRWAAMARLGFERQIAMELDQADSVTTRMRLAEGARYTPTMISELARQTGTFRRPQ